MLRNTGKHKSNNVIKLSNTINGVLFHSCNNDLKKSGLEIDLGSLSIFLKYVSSLLFNISFIQVCR